jgi:hypothetical protein
MKLDIEKASNSDETKAANHSETESNKNSETEINFILIPISPIITPKTTPSKSTLESLIQSSSPVNPISTPEAIESEIVLFLCDKSEHSATTQIKFALIHLDKFLGCKASSSPKFLGHFEFSAQIRSDKAEKAFKHINEGGLTLTRSVHVQL